MDYVSRNVPTGEDEKLLYTGNIAIRESSKEDLEEIVNRWYDQRSWHGMKMSMTEVMWVRRVATGKLDMRLMVRE